MTRTISISGLASGIDTAAIMQSLMAIERRPIARLATQRADLVAANAAIGEIGRLLGATRDAARALHTPGALSANAATSTNEGVAGARSSDNAARATHDITVHTLARVHTLASAPGAALSAGARLDITGAGETHTFEAADGESLVSFAARINAADHPGARASVIDGRLVLTARDTGTAGALTLAGDAVSALGLTTTQAAQDATFTLDGLAITRATNTIDDALDGSTISLTGTGQATITIGPSADAATEHAQALIGAYNALIANLRASTAHDRESGASGTFQGDQMITQITARLRAVASSDVPGAGTLASVGITIARDGQMNLNQERFGAAFADNPDRVRALFGADGGPGGIARRIGEVAGQIATDTLGTRAASYERTIGRLDRKVADMEHHLDLRERTMRAQWDAMERSIITAQHAGAHLGMYLNHLA